jgi:hypothetical protein
MLVPKADVGEWLVNLCDSTIHHVREVAHPSSFSPECITRMILFNSEQDEYSCLVTISLMRSSRNEAALLEGTPRSHQK